MNYSVIAVPEFKKQLKRLAKKYRSFKTELAVLTDEMKAPEIKRQVRNRWKILQKTIRKYEFYNSK